MFVDFFKLGHSKIIMNYPTSLDVLIQFIEFYTLEIRSNGPSSTGQGVKFSRTRARGKTHVKNYPNSWCSNSVYKILYVGQPNRSFSVVHKSLRLGRLIKRTQNYDFIIYFRLRIYFKTKNGPKFEKFEFCLILEAKFLRLFELFPYLKPCPNSLNPRTEGFWLRIFLKFNFKISNFLVINLCLIKPPQTESFDKLKFGSVASLTQCPLTKCFAIYFKISSCASYHGILDITFCSIRNSMTDSDTVLRIF